VTFLQSRSDKTLQGRNCICIVWIFYLQIWSVMEWNLVSRMSGRDRQM